MARSDFVKFRVSEGEEARWWQAAAASGQSLSSWLRGIAEMAVLTGVNGADLRSELVQLRTSLNRGVGTNLNQIAKALNSDPVARRTSGAYVVKNLADASLDLRQLRETIEAAMTGLAGPPRSRRVKASQPVAAMAALTDAGTQAL